MELISKEDLYNKVGELAELARQRVIDTSNQSPVYCRYMAQLNERTRFKELVMDFSTVDAIPRKAIDDAIAEMEEIEEYVFNMPNTDYEAYGCVRNCIDILKKHIAEVGQ